MSNAGDVPELEPLEETVVVAAVPAAAAATPVSLSGMPAPVYSVRASKEYYRFFFAGLVMFLGCLMPFGPQMDLVGYKTLGGAFFILIALMIMWSSWVAIAHNRFGLNNMFWLMLAFIPLGVQTYHLVLAFDEPAVVAYIENAQARHQARSIGATRIVIESWGEFFRLLPSFKTKEISFEIDEFMRAFGTGKIVLWFGSILAEIFLVMGMVTGVRAGKAKKAVMEAERKSRGRR